MLLSSIAFDANGNTLTDASGRSFTWAFENRPVQALVPGTSGGTTTFKYDPFGRRIQKSRWEEKAKMVGMNGLEPSTTAFLRYLPGSGVGAALVCNAEGTQGLSELLNDILKATAQAQ